MGKVESTADRILDVAEQLVQLRGYNSFSYADIAGSLKIRKASIHYHFPSKKDLGRRLVVRYRERFITALEGFEKESRSVRQLLRTYAELWAGVLRDRHRLCLCGMMASESATLPKAIQVELRRFFDDNERWLSRQLEKGRDSGELKLHASPEVEARLITMAFEGGMLVARCYGEPERFEEIARQLLDRLARVR